MLMSLAFRWLLESLRLILHLMLLFIFSESSFLPNSGCLTCACGCKTTEEFFVSKLVEGFFWVLCISLALLSMGHRLVLKRVELYFSTLRVVTRTFVIWIYLFAHPSDWILLWLSLLLLYQFLTRVTIWKRFKLSFIIFIILAYLCLWKIAK
jgi:hypothetical protein